MRLLDKLKLEPELKTLIGIYALLCLVYFFCLGFQLESWRVFAKALPMICLTVWVGKFSNVRYSQLVRAGLAMSVGGDILLELHDIQPMELRFLGGLGCFLITHLCYSLFFGFTLSEYLHIFSQEKRKQPSPSVPHIAGSETQSILSKSNIRTKGLVSVRKLIEVMPKGVLFGVIAYAALFIYWLSPLLGELLLPVTIYIVAISAMLILAWTFYYKHFNAGCWALFAALCFVVSDSLLALKLFVLDVDKLSHIVVHYAVMVTYWMAQLGFALMVFRSTKNRE
jgi:alkenylglycerophosphocholine hydrolase